MAKISRRRDDFTAIQNRVRTYYYSRFSLAGKPEKGAAEILSVFRDLSPRLVTASGACGFLLKSTKGAAFVEALHGLEDSEPPFVPGLAARLSHAFVRIAGGNEQKIRRFCRDSQRVCYHLRIFHRSGEPQSAEWDAQNRGIA